MNLLFRLDTYRQNGLTIQNNKISFRRLNFKKSKKKSRDYQEFVVAKKKERQAGQVQGNDYFILNSHSFGSIIWGIWSITW